MAPEPYLVLGCAPAAVSVALVLDGAGFPVQIIEPDPSAAERALHVMRTHKDRLLPLIGSVLPDRIDGILILSEGEIEISDLADVAKRTTRKCAVLALGSLAGAGKIFDPARCAGVHLFEPIHRRLLAEVEPLCETQPDVVQAAEALAHRLGKTPLRLAPGMGSAALCLLDRMIEAADTLMMDGSTPWEIDEAMVDYGFDIGLYEAQDLAGLDVAYERRRIAEPTRDPARRYIPISDRAVREGRLGKKIGWGWYRYPGGGGAVIDPLVEDLAREEAWFAGITPRPIPEPELIRRLLLALINEAAMLIARGHLADWKQVDLIARSALGFPAKHGGPGAVFEKWGATRVLQELDALCDEDPIVWTPSSLIRRIEGRN